MSKIILIEIVDTFFDNVLFIDNNLIQASDSDSFIDLENITNKLSSSLNLPILNLKLETKDFSEHPDYWDYDELIHWVSELLNNFENPEKEPLEAISFDIEATVKQTIKIIDKSYNKTKISEGLNLGKLTTTLWNNNKNIQVIQEIKEDKTVAIIENQIVEGEYKNFV